MSINAPLLRQTLAHIEAHPETWDQVVFRCSTGMCFAGWACQLAGGRWVSSDPDGPYGEHLVPEPDDDECHVFTFRDGTKGVMAEWRAMRILGLTNDQVTRLFAPTNDLGRLTLIVSELCEEAGS